MDLMKKLEVLFDSPFLIFKLKSNISKLDAKYLREKIMSQTSFKPELIINLVLNIIRGVYSIIYKTALGRKLLSIITSKDILKTLHSLPTNSPYDFSGV